MTRKVFVTGFILAFVLIVATLTPGAMGYAEQKPLVDSVVFEASTDKYFVNGSAHGVTMDTTVLIRDDRTFVPVRFLSNALGVTNDHISWDNPRVILSQPGFSVVTLVIGERFIIVDGQSKQMDVAPLIKDKRTMLPARFVAEALGYQVRWCPVSRSVIIWPTGLPEPSAGHVVASPNTSQQSLPVLDPPVVDAKPGNSRLADEYVMINQGYQMLELVNTARLQHGLKPYLWDNQLAIVAKNHSRDMLNNKFFSHTSPTTGTPSARLSAAGINWRSCGENIAMQTPPPDTPQVIFERWMASPGHRANILNADFTHLGIGIAGGYYIQKFVSYFD